MNASVNAYLRNDDLIVVPRGGRGGVYFELDDLRSLSPASVSDVKQALEEMLRRSSEEAGLPLPNLRDRPWFLLKRIGVKSPGAFYRNVSYCCVFVEGDTIEVIPHGPRKDKRGFEPIGQSVFVADLGSLAEVVLRVLKDSPRINPAP